MENPLAGLPKWGQVAVVGGGALVVFLAWKNHESSTASSTATDTAANTSGSTAASGTAGEITDPTTGEQYSDSAIDPITGQDYLTEITDYGSVSAADEMYEENGDLNGFSYENGTLTESPYSSTTGSVETGTNYANNAQWSQAAQQGLTEIGYSATDVASALGDYLNSIPMSSDYASIVNTAIAEYGEPPSGSYTIKIAPSSTTTTSTPTTTSTTSSDTVTVPNEVGRTDLATAKSELTAAGFKAASTGDTGTGNTGKVTSQSPAGGTKAAKGSTVTLVYTANTADNPKVSVPNEIGRTDLDTAVKEIQNAGLKAKTTGTLSKAKGNKGKVTSTSPAPGAKVAKGSTVTITYK